jgi:hypothetical protein
MPPEPVTGLSWNWIALMGSVPLVVGLVVAYPFWRRTEAIFGNILGTGVIFSAAFAMIWREHLQIDQIVQQCLDAGTTCFPQPAAFTRFAIYCFIALAEVCIVFMLSLRVEERIRRRDYAPEWR